MHDLPEQENMKNLVYLSNLWNEDATRGMDEAELLRYRSNLLGADLRLTNFGGGNTSSKITQQDSITGESCPVLWVKGSGGDLGSIKRSGFATLYLDKLRALEKRYKGPLKEDEMVAYYALCTFGQNATAASIDTPLHGFLPFAHIDHLHPDWAIALAASANAAERLGAFNLKFGHKLVWVPWQRPGFELGLMIRNAVRVNPGCDGLILGSHGLFTWGNPQRECYESTLHIIDDLGQFVQSFVEQAGDKLFGGRKVDTRPDRCAMALEFFPILRGRLSTQQRLIGHFNDAPDVLRFVNSADARALAGLGTSCPDHFIRTKIQPVYIPGNDSSGLEQLTQLLDTELAAYREGYVAYYKTHSGADSPGLREAVPSVVLVPGLGMFSFGKNKTEARITGEFYTNAIHVMECATTLDDGKTPAQLPQAGKAAPSEAFSVFKNYVALPRSEAFRIEYWQLEEAKLRRQPPEGLFSRKVFVVVGGASGIGRAVATAAVREGAHVVVADRDLKGAQEVVQRLSTTYGTELLLAVRIDLQQRSSIQQAFLEVVSRFGGFDVVVNTAAIFPVAQNGHLTEEQWQTALNINVTANYLLGDEANQLFRKQALQACIVLTSSANAVVAKRGSEAYDISKAAVSHLVREFAVSFGPLVRVNAISPATVVKGSTMFPRDRVIDSLSKYGIPFDRTASDDSLRDTLSAFYAKRTITGIPITPEDCAEAILFLASDRCRCTSGHIFPVDGGLPEAFLR
jgi:rhamnose utilization protein RhaD (predicted bifunctional aldolase and dehydrogenase)/NAD(P)-dependent dehydrogenase (short-subunit alcohol dehydrogenase family)